MLTTEILSIAAIIIAVLIYFAGVQRGKTYRSKDKKIREKELIDVKKQRKKDERDNRIKEVVDRYRELVNNSKASNFNGMLRAGVLGLHDSSEVEEVCLMIKREGLRPGIPKSYMDELRGNDLLLFFNLFNQRKSNSQAEGEIRAIIKEVIAKSYTQ